MAAIPDISGYVRQATAVELPAPMARSVSESGDPREAAVVLYEDDDIEIGIWECTPGRFPGTRVGYNELMVFVSGAGTITTADGVTKEIGPGVVYPSLDGWQATWDITATARKVYVIWGDTR